jgi:hypothetical protein
MANIEILSRGFQTAQISPPRKAGSLRCSNEDPATVTVQLGKGAAGRIFSTSYKIDVRRYMTKQQRELTGEET